MAALFAGLGLGLLGCLVLSAACLYFAAVMSGDSTPESSGSGLAPIIEAVAAKVAPLIGAQAQRWVGELIDATRAKLLPLLPTEVQGAVIAGLEKLKAAEPLLSDTTSHGFLAIVHHLALGNEDGARLAWLGEGASFRDRMNALDKSSEVTRALAQSRAARWSTVRTVALDFLEAAGKAAVPVLLAFVPI